MSGSAQNKRAGSAERPAPTPAAGTSTASAESSTPAANRTGTAVLTTVLRGWVNLTRATSAPALTTVLRGGAPGRPTHDSSNGAGSGRSSSEPGGGSKVVIAGLIAAVLAVAAAAAIGVVACQKSPSPAAKMSQKAGPAGHRGFANPVYGGSALDDSAFELGFGPGAPGVQLHATYTGPAMTHPSGTQRVAPKTAFAQCNGRQPISSSTV